MSFNGAFLRLGAKRDVFDTKLRKSQALEAEISTLEDHTNRLSTQLIQAKIDQEHERAKQLQTEIDQLHEELTVLRSKNERSGIQLMQTITC